LHRHPCQTGDGLGECQVLRVEETGLRMDQGQHPGQLILCQQRHAHRRFGAGGRAVVIRTAQPALVLQGILHQDRLPSGDYPACQALIQTVGHLENRGVVHLPIDTSTARAADRCGEAKQLPRSAPTDWVA